MVCRLYVRFKFDRNHQFPGSEFRSVFAFTLVVFVQASINVLARMYRRRKAGYKRMGYRFEDESSQNQFEL